MFTGSDMPNDHARSQSEEEVPITMQSNADFHAVQQKLAVKKPFYKGIFKSGKERKGDNNLSDSDGLSFKHTYNREVLIDFPPEQRTRQLVNHYGQEKPSERANRLPNRSKKKHDVRNKGYDEEGPAKMLNVGRVTVTAPTRV
ncbi:Partitioning defective 3 [Porites harrisoni]